MTSEQTQDPTTISVRTQWLNKNEIARHFRCSVRHVNNLMSSRVLPHVKIGRFVRFDQAACDAAMKHYQIKSFYG